MGSLVKCKIIIATNVTMQKENIQCNQSVYVHKHTCIQTLIFNLHAYMANGLAYHYNLGEPTVILGAFGLYFFFILI